MGGDLFIPAGLDGGPEHGRGPELLFAVRVGNVETAALAVVAGGAAEVSELVAAFPAAVAEGVAHGLGVRMGGQRLLGRGEAGIVDGDVAALAAVNLRTAERRDDGLLNLGLTAFQCGALRIGLCLGQRLMEVGRLVVLPAALELVIDDHADPDQYQQADYG